MTNEKVYSPVSYGCNGATVKFSFPWKILTQNDLTVYLKSADSVSTLKLGVDYSVKYEEMGGEITTLETYATGNSIMIYRNVSNLQSKSYSTSPGFQASEIEKSFDLVSCNLQEMDWNIENFKTTFSSQIENEIDNLEGTIQDNKQEVLTIQERFEDEVNTKLEQVSEAAGKIAEFEESIEVAVEASNIATQKAEEAKNYLEQSKESLVEIENKIVANDVKMADTLQRAQTAENNAIKALASTLNESQITNCVTEVPQNIKMELDNGLLTLKKGSIVIVPTGTIDRRNEYPVGARFLNDNLKVHHTQFVDGKFTVWAETTKDITYYEPTPTKVTDKYLLYLRIDNCSLFRRATEPQSGTSVPTGFNSVYFNTETNYCKTYYSSNSTEYYSSLPLGRVSSNMNATNNISKIDEVFNGFGNIGCYYYADKGVKFLSPYGRNEDGTLINREFTTTILVDSEVSGTTRTNQALVIAQNYFGPQAQYNYDEENNYNYRATDKTGGVQATALVGYTSCANNVVTQFDVFKPFRAVDYNEALLKTDKKEITGWSMPSDKFVSLTVGASGATYTAPADGYFVFSGLSSAANQYFTMWVVNNDLALKKQYYSHATNQYLGDTLPVAKGSALGLDYTLGGEKVLYFVYAKGAI